MSNPVEERLRTLLNEASDEVISVSLGERARATAHRRRRRQSVTSATAAVAAVVGVVLSIWVVRGSSSTRVGQVSASGAGPTHTGSQDVIATGNNGPLTLEVLGLNRAASSPRAGSECMTVTFMIRNAGAADVPVSGSDLLSFTLLDEGGPVTETSGATVRHLAATDFWSCDTPAAPQGAQPAHVRPSTPPDAQLAPGTFYGPYTLAFTVTGPGSQPLSLVWDGPDIPLP
jgi:hypothetical protein